MKRIYQIFVCVLLTVSCFIQTMDKIRKKKSVPQTFSLQNWAIDTGFILIGRKDFLKGTAIIQQNRNFLKLKPSIQSNIIGALQSCTRKQNFAAVSTGFNILVSSSEQLDQLINDSAFSLKLIKHYSTTMGITDSMSCCIIATRAAHERLELQNYYSSCICSDINLLDPLVINSFYSSDFDLSFIDSEEQTLGAKCVTAGNAQAIRILLKKGVNPDPLYKLAIQYSDLNNEDRQLMIGILRHAVNKKAAEEKYSKK